MVPLILVLLNELQYSLSLLVFTLAGISDGLDGWIAKKYNLRSNFGAMLDAIADKLLLVSTYAMLTMLGDIPFWLLVLVGFRDITIVGGYFLLAAMDKKVTVKPIWISKLNTFMQIVLVLLVLVHRSGWLLLDASISVIISVVAFTTLTSGLMYLWSGVQQGAAQG